MEFDVFKKSLPVNLFYCCLFMMIISCSGFAAKPEYKILGTFEDTVETGQAIAYFVYVNDFKDEPGYWAAMREFSNHLRDDKYIFQKVYFLYEPDAASPPEKIDVEDFRAKYIPYCIFRYEIDRGLDVDMATKYPFFENKREILEFDNAEG